MTEPTGVALSHTLPPARYDVFVSYRAASSGTAARQVAQALFTLSKRHLQDRRLRVFLDTEALVAGTLSHNITSALEHAQNLVVCLDSSTRESTWVSKEIEHWLEHGGDPARLFLVRTEVALDLSWDVHTHAFAQPEALPAPLRTVFHEEQKYFDVPVGGRVDASSLAGLYAALMRIDPADLALEEARYQRRRRVVLSAFTSGLAILLVLAIIASVLAIRASRRSAESALQARGEAAAAQALLTLPYSAPDAIDQVLQASRMSDSLSVRSALIAVASSTGALRRTVDWAALQTGHQVTGMVFSGDGENLIGWGPAAAPGATRLAAWSVTSGERVVDTDLPVADLSNLVEVAAVGYLACSPDGPVLVARRTYAVQKLGSRDAPVATCSTRNFRGGGLVETASSEEGPSEVTYVSYMGRVRTFARTAVERVDPQSWSAALGTSDGLVLVSARGDVRVDLANRLGTRMASSTGRYLVQDKRGWMIVRQLPDGRNATIDRLALPDDVRTVSLYGWGRLTEAGYAWVDSRGRLGWSRSSATVQLPAPLSGPATGAADLVPGDFNSLVVTYGGTVYRAEPPEYSEAWKLSVLGDYQADEATGGTITSFCDEGGAIGLPDDRWLVQSLTSSSAPRTPFAATSEDAHLEGCTVVDPGPPLSIDGVKVTEGALDGQVVTSPGTDQGGSVAIVRPGAPTQLLNTGGHVENTWRFFNDSSILAADGERRVTSSDETTTSEKGHAPAAVLGDLSGQLRAVSPDGLGAAVAVTGKNEPTSRYLRNGRALPACDASVLEFLPGRSFPTSVADAEAQVPVSRADGWQNCLTGQQYDFPDDITVEDYQIGTDSARIVWSQTDAGATTRHLTTWRPGHEESLSTRELPAVEVRRGSTVRVALDPTTEHLAMSDSGSGLVRTWSWSGKTWTVGTVLQSSLGAVAMPAWSSDGAFVYTIGRKGGFELFDATSGRRLVVDQKGFELSEDESSPHVLVSEARGFSFVHLTTSRGGELSSRTLEVAVSVDQLRDLLCVVHPAPACTG